MPTPADAPYKLAQRAAEDALRRGRRAAQVDRRKLRAVALVLAVEGGDPDRLRSLLAMMTRRERAAHAESVALAHKLDREGA